MDDTETIPCPKCAAPAPDRRTRPPPCFKCGGIGRVFRDPFVQTFGPGPRKYFGISYPFGSAVLKGVETAASLELAQRWQHPGATVTEITEEQAREFFGKHGANTLTRPGA